MKTHSIIPVFLPELGCPGQCVFCNQKHVSGREFVPHVSEIPAAIHHRLESMRRQNRFIEIAFFGGSFTLLPIELQRQYLISVQPFLESGEVKQIRISTRPDGIDDRVLTMLKKYGVRTIELGVQSFDDDVLGLSGRGYSSSVIWEAAGLIRKHDFALGMQMMIGLPGSNRQKDIGTAHNVIRSGASGARIYPTLVLRDTVLEKQYLQGLYTPLGLEEAIETGADVLEMFNQAGIITYKVGLHPGEFLHNGSFLAGPWVPSFRQHVQARIWRRKILELVSKKNPPKVLIVHPSDLNSFLGPQKCNDQFFRSEGINFIIQTSIEVNKGSYNAIYS